MHGWIRIIGFAALLLGAQAHADGLACGQYRALDLDSSQVLTITNTQQAQTQGPDAAPTLYLYELKGAQLELLDIDNGNISRFALRDSGKHLASAERGVDSYRFAKPLQCATSTVPPPGVCRGNLGQCLATYEDAKIATLQAYCDEGLPFACKRLIDAYQAEFAGDADRDVGVPPEPAVCKKTTPAYNERACNDAALAMLGQERVKDLSTLLLDAPKPLAPARLDGLGALCSRHPSASLCNQVAQTLWTGGRYLDAKAALQTACTPGGDPDACKTATALASLDAATLTTSAVTTLPCGEYTATTGLMSELTFGDRGRVEGSLGSVMRARLEGGQVRIRHDKGGDFVLQPLPGNRLLGIDSWNRYAVYQRQGGAGQCSAPIVYREQPLVQDCPVLTGADAASTCCARGNLHGCNVLGNQRALAGDWAGAKDYYAKVCASGVRIGCENLLQVYGRGGDESAQGALQKICAADARHVACDVDATANWAMLGLGAALLQAADELEAEDDEVAPIEPSDDADSER